MKAKRIATPDIAALTLNAVMYLGASCSRKTLLVIRPAALAQAVMTAEARARALRLGMLETVQVAPIGLMG